MNANNPSVIVECTTGNIVNQPDIDVIVSAANAYLESGGGVAGAIHTAAGPGLAEECRQLAPIRPGEAVISSGHHLPNAWVIHCLGPVYGVDKHADKLLAACYTNALRLADGKDLHRIAFPAISTGAFGYPPEAAATVCALAVSQLLPELKTIELIRFVLPNDTARATLQQAFVDAG